MPLTTISTIEIATIAQLTCLMLLAHSSRLTLVHVKLLKRNHRPKRKILAWNGRYWASKQQDYCRFARLPRHLACVGLQRWKGSMDRIATEQSIRICLTETGIKKRSISKAAVACADAGSVSEATMVSKRLGQLLHDAGHLHDAASLLNKPRKRIGKRPMKKRLAVDQAALQVAIHPPR